MCVCVCVSKCTSECAHACLFAERHTFKFEYVHPYVCTVECVSLSLESFCAYCVCVNVQWVCVQACEFECFVCRVSVVSVQKCVRIRCVCKSCFCAGVCDLGVCLRVRHVNANGVCIRGVSL